MPNLNEISLEQHIDIIHTEYYHNGFFSNGEPRKQHGKRHFVRAMILGTVGIRFLMDHHPLGIIFKKYPHFSLYCKIALLLHDCAREDDGKDRWDRQSAAKIYEYLRKHGVGSEEAAQVAEAMANKDYRNIPEDKTTYQYYKAVVKDDQINWQEITLPTGKEPEITDELKAMLLAIQFGDCVDILRARGGFERKYLMYQQEFANSTNKTALQKLPQLLRETRSLLDNQGDFYWGYNPKLQESFDKNTYPKTLALIAEKYPIIHAYYHGLDLPKQSPAKEEDSLVEEIFQLMQDGQLMVRGIPSVSALNENTQTKYPGETKAAIEFRKMLRANKGGNFNRSVGVFGGGCLSYAGVGGGWTKKGQPELIQAHKRDADTGRDKKKHITSQSPDEIAEIFAELQQEIISGCGTDRHCEIIAEKITHYDFIWYTTDPTCYDGMLDKKFFHPPHHPNIPALEAIYLQQEARQQTKNSLPIFNISSVHNTVEAKHFSEQAIFAMWEQLFNFNSKNYLLNELINYSEYHTDESLEKAKVWLVFGGDNSWIGSEKLTSLDKYYPTNLKEKINELTKKTLVSMLNKTIQRIKDDIASFDTKSAEEQSVYLARFFEDIDKVLLLNNGSLLREQIFTDFCKSINSNSIMKNGFFIIAALFHPEKLVGIAKICENFKQFSLFERPMISNLIEYTICNYFTVLKSSQHKEAVEEFYRAQIITYLKHIENDPNMIIDHDKCSLAFKNYSIIKKEFPDMLEEIKEWEQKILRAIRGAFWELQVNFNLVFRAYAVFSQQMLLPPSEQEKRNTVLDWPSHGLKINVSDWKLMFEWWCSINQFDVDAKLLEDFISSANFYSDCDYNGYSQGVLWRGVSGLVNALLEIDHIIDGKLSLVRGSDRLQVIFEDKVFYLLNDFNLVPHVKAYIKASHFLIPGRIVDKFLDVLLDERDVFENALSPLLKREVVDCFVGFFAKYPIADSNQDTQQKYKQVIALYKKELAEISTFRHSKTPPGGGFWRQPPNEHDEQPQVSVGDVSVSHISARAAQL